MKGKKSKKEEEEEVKEETLPEQCAVCRGTRWQAEDFQQLKCQTCHLSVHKNCYYPEFKEKDKNRFKCDSCKKRNSKNKEKQPSKHTCSHCGHSSGMLKEIGNQEWMHVLCALTSPRTTLQSYLTLSFAASTPVQKQANKNRKCSYCNKENNKQAKGEGVPCYIEGCKPYFHLNCVVDNADTPPEGEESNYDSSIIFGMLDKNEGILKSWLQKQMSNSLQGLAILPKSTVDARYVVCGEHNNNGEFVWCPCNEIEQVSNTMTVCEQCERWYHNACLEKYNFNLKEDVCKACKDNDIFLKNLRLPELIAIAAKTQRLAHLDKQSIKFLDHFCFKLSDHLTKLVKEKTNSFQIERYFLRHFLDQDAGKDDLEEEVKEAQIMEVLHYLLRREHKSEQEITAEHLQEMLAELSGKGNKFQWSQEKNEKTEKKYKDFIVNKLKRIKKDSLRQARLKLTQFSKSNNEVVRPVQEIAQQLHPILEALDQSEAWKKQAQSFVIKDDHHLLQFFNGTSASKEDITDVLKGIKKLLHVKNHAKVIHENEYNSIVLKNYDFLSQKKAKQLKTIHMALLKGIRQTKVFQQRKQILQNIENKYQKCTSECKQQLRNTLINKGVMIPSSSGMFKLQIDSIEAEICRKQYLKKYNPPEPSELGPAIISLSNLLSINKGTGILTKNEKIHFQQLLNKYSFYQFIIFYASSQNRPFAPSQIQSGMLTQPNTTNTILQNGNHRVHRQHNQEKLEQKLREVTRSWPLSYQLLLTALNLLHSTAKNKIKWTEAEAECLRFFFDELIRVLQNQTLEGKGAMKSSILVQIKDISTSLNVSERYTRYIEKYNSYVHWKQQLEVKFKRVEKALEDSEDCAKMLEIIEQKMSEIAYYSREIDLSVETRKLKLLRVWIIFSQKFLAEERSTTIAGIQSAKSLMEKIQYPKNKVRSDIERLDQEAKSLNKRITRFIEKQKIGDMQFYEELRFIQSKMSLKEANELQRDLQNSSLDVQIQLNQLKDEIANARNIFPQDIEQFCRESKDFESISKLRRELLQNPFIMVSPSQYQHLLHRYYSLKCEGYSEPISKKEYYRLLNHGGSRAVELLARTMPLYQAYKQIEAAEKQVLSARQKTENLLSQDIKKYRTDLNNDPVQLSRIQRYFTLANKYRHQFSIYKEQRADVQKFNQLLNDILRLPINCNDIVSQIARMKRQIDELALRIRNLMLSSQNQTMSYDGPFTDSMLCRYQRIGMRCKQLQEFEETVIKAQQISELSRNVSFENYKIFSLQCFKAHKLWSNDEFYRQRQFAFEKIYPLYLESSEPLIEVSLALIEQGGYLIKRPNTAKRILPILVKIHQKHFKWGNQNIEDRNQAQQRDLPEEAEQQYDSDEFEEEDLDSDELLGELEKEDQEDVEVSDSELDFEDEDVSGGQSSEERKQGKSKKRPRPKDNEFVISDDD